MNLRDYRLEPPEAPAAPPCPVCGSDMYDTIYENGDGIVGCDICISHMSAEDWWEELEKQQREEERC